MNDEVETPEEQLQENIDPIYSEIKLKYGSLKFEDIDSHFMAFQNIYNEKRDIESIRVKKDILEAAKKFNLTLHIKNGNDITDKYGLQKNKTKPPKMEPKYRNPDNHNETWAGHGRKPKWLIEKIASGKKLDDFMIEQPNKQVTQ